MMEDLFVKINTYLEQGTYTNKDVIITGVITALFILFFSGVFKKINTLLVKLFSIIVNMAKVLNRKYIKRIPTLKEMIKIEERLGAGGALKWYEKEYYNKHMEQLKESEIQQANRIKSPTYKKIQDELSVINEKFNRLM